MLLPDAGVFKIASAIRTTGCSPMASPNRLSVYCEATEPVLAPLALGHPMCPSGSVTPRLIQASAQSTSMSTHLASWVAK